MRNNRVVLRTMEPWSNHAIKVTHLYVCNWCVQICGGFPALWAKTELSLMDGHWENGRENAEPPSIIVTCIYRLTMMTRSRGEKAEQCHHWCCSSRIMRRQSPKTGGGWRWAAGPGITFTQGSRVARETKHCWSFAQPNHLVFVSKPNVHAVIDRFSGPHSHNQMRRIQT